MTDFSHRPLLSFATMRNYFSLMVFEKCLIIRSVDILIPVLKRLLSNWFFPFWECINWIQNKVVFLFSLLFYFISSPTPSLLDGCPNRNSQSALISSSSLIQISAALLRNFVESKFPWSKESQAKSNIIYTVKYKQHHFVLQQEQWDLRW